MTQPTIQQLYDAIVASQEDGGEQTIRRLGPFHIAHDTPGILVSGDNPAMETFPGVELIAVASGALMVGVWVAITEGWTNGPSINVGTSEGPGGGGGLMTLAATADITAPSAHHQSLLVGSFTPGVFTDGDGLNVAVIYGEVDGPPAAGEADIYALIAEPAP